MRLSSWQFIGSAYDFCVGGACYPEVHLEGVDLEREIEYCRIKVETVRDS